MNRLFRLIKRILPGKIRYQLIGGIALVHLILMLLFVADLVNRQRNFLKKQNHEQALTIANEFAVNSTSYMIANDIDGLERLVNSYRNFPHLQYAMLLSINGTVMAHTDRKFLGKKPVDSISLSLKYLPETQTLVENNYILDIAVPVLYNNEMVGMARIGLDQQYIYNNLQDIVRNGIMYIIAALIIGSVFAVIIAGMLSRSLYRLIDTADEIRRGNRNIRMHPAGAYEISRLGIAFNQMLDEISSHERFVNTILENMPVGVWVLDEKGKVISVNKTGREIWAGVRYVNLEEYDHYKAWYLRTGSMLKASDWAAFRAIRNGETSINEEIVIETFDKSHKIILNSAIPLLDIHQRVIGAIAINVDITERKMAEETIRNNEEKMSLMINGSLDAIVTIDADGTIVSWNHEAEKIFGWKREEILGSPLTESIVPLQHREAHQQGMRHYFATGIGPYLNRQVEVTAMNRQGKEFPIELSIIPIIQSGVTSFTAFIRDISGRKKAELEILKLNRLYKFISQISETILKLGDSNAVYSEACRIAVEYGKFRFSWIGMYDEEKEAVVPAYWAGHEEGYLSAIQILANDTLLGSGPTGKAIRNRNFYFCNDIANDPDMLPWREEALKRNYRSSIALPIIVSHQMTAVYTLYMNEPFFFNETEITLLREVTDNIAYALDKIRLREMQLKSEAELRESEEKFRTLVEQSQVGVFILRDEQFIYVNPVFEKITGYPKDYMLQQIRFEQLIHEEDAEMVYLNKEWVEQGADKVHQFVTRAIRSDGEVIYIEIIVSSILYHNQPAVLGTVIDITDRLEEENRIRKAVTDAQEKERMQIGMELHDNVKQLLAASGLHLDYLKQHLHEPRLAAETIEAVKNYIHEAVHELRQISHRLAPSVSSTDILREKIEQLVQIMNKENNLQVILDIHDFDPPLSNDLQLSLYRILQEQFSNIIKYANASRVDIQIAPYQHAVQMSIRDNGRGFDPLTRKEGIGLENIRRRADVFKGRVKILSSVGAGCEIIVQIPVQQSGILPKGNAGSQ